MNYMIILFGLIWMHYDLSKAHVEFHFNIQSNAMRIQCGMIIIRHSHTVIKKKKSLKDFKNCSSTIPCGFKEIEYVNLYGFHIQII